MADPVVIGGGFAGLSAAAALAAAGVRATLLEARPTLGGRATAFTDPETGERVDNGQHVLFGCYHETFRFLERIGTSGRVQLQENLTVSVIDRSGRRTTLACPPLPAPLHLVGGVLRWEALTWRDRLAVLRMGPALRAGGGAAARTTVEVWLRQCGQTPRLIELLWEPLALAALNQPVGVAAAAPFREVLRRMFTTDRRDSAIGVPAVPLDALYAHAARAFIEARGGTVTTGSPARLREAASGLWSVRTRTVELTAPVVICAVPWHELPDVLPRAPALEGIVMAAAATPASPIVTVNLWFDRDVSPAAFVGLPSRHMQWMFDKRRIFGGGSAHLSLVSSGADAIAARSNPALVELARTEVDEAIPAARSAILQRAVVVRERRATFSLAPGAPARPPVRTGLPGLYLAGDWIDTGLPATIESAVVSGHRAAAAALEYLSGRPPAP